MIGAESFSVLDHQINILKLFKPTNDTSYRLTLTLDHMT